VNNLEQLLLSTPSIKSGAEWQVDVLRNVLLGQIGTKAQRAALIRIIKQNLRYKNRNIHHRLLIELGEKTQNDNTYL